MQVRREGTGWHYRGQECPGRERHIVGEDTAQDRRQREGWEGALWVQMQDMEYEEIPAGTGKGAWSRRQDGRVDLWVTGGGEAVLQLQHRRDVGTGWGVEKDVQMRQGEAIWIEPRWMGRY